MTCEAPIRFAKRKHLSQFTTASLVSQPLVDHKTVYKLIVSTSFKMHMKQVASRFPGNSLQAKKPILESREGLSSKERVRCLPLIPPSLPHFLQLPGRLPVLSSNVQWSKLLPWDMAMCSKRITCQVYLSLHTVPIKHPVMLHKFQHQKQRRNREDASIFKMQGFPK